TVAILLVGTGIRDAAFTFDVRQWLGLAAGLLFFAALPIGVALLAGALAGQRVPQRSNLPSMPTRQGPMPAQRSGPHSEPRTWGDVRNQAPREDWRNNGGWDDLPPSTQWGDPEAPRPGPPGQYAPPSRSGRQPGDSARR